jgi:hypothetical protein
MARFKWGNEGGGGFGVHYPSGGAWWESRISAKGDPSPYAHGETYADMATATLQATLGRRPNAGEVLECVERLRRSDRQSVTASRNTLTAYAVRLAWTETLFEYTKAGGLLVHDWRHQDWAAKQLKFVVLPRKDDEVVLSVRAAWSCVSPVRSHPHYADAAAVMRWIITRVTKPSLTVTALDLGLALPSTEV